MSAPPKDAPTQPAEPDCGVKKLSSDAERARQLKSMLGGERSRDTGRADQVLRRFSWEGEA